MYKYLFKGKDKYEDYKNIFKKAIWTLCYRKKIKFSIFILILNFRDKYINILN